MSQRNCKALPLSNGQGGANLSKDKLTLKKGDTVVMHSCGEAEHYDGKIWVCRNDEFISSSGSPAVFLEGFSGYFYSEYLQRVDLGTV